MFPTPDNLIEKGGRYIKPTNLKNSNVFSVAWAFYLHFTHPVFPLGIAELIQPLVRYDSCDDFTSVPKWLKSGKQREGLRLLNSVYMVLQALKRIQTGIRLYDLEVYSYLILKRPICIFNGNQKNYQDNVIFVEKKISRDISSVSNSYIDASIVDVLISLFSQLEL